MRCNTTMTHFTSSKQMLNKIGVVPLILMCLQYSHSGSGKHKQPKHWVCAVSLDETSRVTPNLSSFRQTDLQVLLATRTMELYVLHNKRSCSSLLLLPPPPPTPSSLWIRLLSAECSFSGKHRNVTNMLSFLSSRASAARQSRQAAKQ